MAGRLPGRALIDRRPPRALFSELLAGALERTRVEPSPLATAYLVELLDERVRRAPAAGEAPTGPASSLAEELLQARLERGRVRVRRLRGLGDRVLFATGFFRDSLERRSVGLAYCRDAGRLAYAGVSAALRSLGGSLRGETPAPVLFEELADRFPEFSEVLTEVGDRTRASLPGGLDALYVRFLRTGSERDRRRLARRGHAVPDCGTPSAQ
jgi:hypothetical protein